MKKIVTTLSILLFSLGNVFSQLNPDIEWTFFEIAEKNRLRNKLQSAILDYEEAIKINPNQSVFYYGLAECYFKNRDINNAILNFETALQLNPQCSRSYAKILKLYKRTNNREKQLDILQKWSANSTTLEGKIECDISYVKILLEDCNYQEANKQLKETLSYASENSELYYLYSLVNNKLNLYDEAIYSAQKSLELAKRNRNSKTCKIYYELGVAFHHLNMPAERNRVFSKIHTPYYNYLILQLYTPFYKNIAQLYAHTLFDYTVAEQFLNKGLKINEYAEGINKLYAKITADRKLSEQPTYAKQLVTNSKQTIEGQIKTLQNANNKSAKQIRENICKEYNSLIRILIKQEKYLEAIASIEEVSQLFNSSHLSERLNGLKAISLYKVAKVEEAIELLNSSIQNQQIPLRFRQEYNFQLGYIYHNLNQDGKAIAAYRKALKGNSIIRNAAQYNLDIYSSNNCQVSSSVDGFVQN